MKKSLLLLALVACFGTALADNSTAVKKELTADYGKVSNAFKNNKIDAISSLLTDDYTVIQPDGKKYTKVQVISQFKTLAGQVHVTKWQRTIRTLTLSGKKAIAIVDGSFAGEASTGGQQMHTLGQTAVTKDTWVKTAKGYRLQKSEVQKNSMTMDGKPMGGH